LAGLAITHRDVPNLVVARANCDGQWLESVSLRDKTGTIRGELNCCDTNLRKVKREKMYFREFEQVNLAFLYLYLEIVDKSEIQ